MTEVDEWYEAPKDFDAITQEELEKLCAKVAEQRAVCDAKADELKAQNKILEELEQAVVAFLKHSNRSNYGSKVGTLSLRQMRSWSLPKTPEDRTAFFNHLKKQGMYQNMITVNSATLNSYLRAEFENAQKDGRSSDFAVPGIGEPSVRETLAMIKPRNK